VNRSSQLAIAVPAYFAPGNGWNRLAGRGGAAALAVVNPNSGPGAAVEPAYAQAIRRAQAHGVRVFGYVHTSYGARPQAAVLAEAEGYRDWYAVDGIFFDEARSDRAGQPYYAALRRALKARDSALLIALNPGTRPDERYMDVAEVVVTFEGDFASYLREPTPPAWMQRLAPSRFWQIVYGVPDAAALQQVLASAGEGHAGYIYITDGTLPNPYGALPSYWTEERRAVAATPSLAWPHP